MPRNGPGGPFREVKEGRMEGKCRIMENPVCVARVLDS